MGPAMQMNPWAWSVADVVSFFENDAHDLISDMPNRRLPTMATFVTHLRSNDVSGAVLLTAVDSDFLRNDCGIGSLGVRTAVLRCIHKLNTYAYSDEQHVGSSASKDAPKIFAPIPISVPHAPEAVIAAHPQAAVVPQNSAQQISRPDSEIRVGQNVRQNETQVYDEHGHKRRKLTLAGHADTVPAQPAKQSALQNRLAKIESKDLTVDSIFYGMTDLGGEIKEVNPKLGFRAIRCHDVATDANDSDENNSNDSPEHLDDENFALVSTAHTPWQSSYVMSQLRHYFQTQPTDLSRNGRIAYGVLPYRESLVHAKRPRSATVIQIASSGRAIAVRENASFLHSGIAVHESRGLVDGGEWDFLLEKYATRGSSDGLPILNTSDDDHEITSSLADEIEAEEQEMLSKNLKHSMDEEAIDQMINQEVCKIRERAMASILAKADKNAWKIWRRMRGRKSLRRDLIKSAEERIAHLEARLAKLKAQLIAMPDGSSKSWPPAAREISAACKAMEPTIEDIEEQKWHLTVWNGQHEPPHVVTHVWPPKSVHKRAKGSSHRHLDDNDGSDKWSGLPGEQAEVTGSHAKRSPHHGDHTGSVSSKKLPAYESLGPNETLSAASFIVDDDASTEMSISSVSDDTAKILPKPALSPEARHSPPNSTNTTLRNIDPECSDEEELPTPRALLRRSFPKIKVEGHSHTPTTKRLVGSSNSAVPATSGGGNWASPSKNHPKMLNDPTDPFSGNSNDVKSWDMRELISRRDTARIMIKHLQTRGSNFHTQLSKCLKDCPGFGGAIKEALRLMRLSTCLGPVSVSKIDRDAARMFLTFLLPESYYDGLAPGDLERVNGSQLDHHLKNFLSMLSKAISTKSLFDLRSVADDPILISSSGDEDTPIHTPHKTRKRAVKESEAAKESQNIALARQEEYNITLQALSQETRDISTRSSATLINILKREDEDDIYVIDRIAKKIKPYQIEGVRFLWREVTAGGEEAQGCVLAHTMGLGKTLQTITFLAAIAEVSRSRNPRLHRQIPPRLRLHQAARQNLRVLVICPAALIGNWRHEIRAWSGDLIGNVYEIVSDVGVSDRIFRLSEWHRSGGVLLIGYEVFRDLVNRKTTSSPDDRIQSDELLLQGPDIVVADEAHTLKNPKAHVSEIAGRFQTRSRIGLTGTPMSNDLQEIYAIVSFVAPNYLGEPKEFKANFAEPILQGTFKDSTRFEIRKGMKKLQVLRTKIDPKVNRADVTVLRGELRPKVEFVVTVELTDAQQELYKNYVAALVPDRDGHDISQTTLWTWLERLSYICNHPRIFKRRFLETPKKLHGKFNSDESRRERSSQRPADSNGSSHISMSQSVLGDDDEADLEANAQYDAAACEQKCREIAALIPDDSDPMLSAKSHVLMKILKHATNCGDKTLVFSHSLHTLDYLQEMLVATRINFGRIDGHINPAKRLPILEDFQGHHCDVLLISTRAGGVGLNIQCANRVVLLDFRFNPAIEEQAVGRAYRIGQTKPVFVYRLITGGTFETKIYNRHVFKSSLSQRVVDRKNPRRAASRPTRDWVFKPRPVQQQDLRQWIGKDPMVMDKLIEEQSSTPANPSVPIRRDAPQPRIRELSTMEILQEDVTDEPLTVDEQREVDEEVAFLASQRNGPQSFQTYTSAASQAVNMRRAALISSGLSTANTQLLDPAHHNHVSQAISSQHRTLSEELVAQEPKGYYHLPFATASAPLNQRPAPSRTRHANEF